MKLLSCYIENFGKIRGESLTFRDGLTSVCEKNGYGKTTLAAFFKAMFYGMDSAFATSKFNDRAHYCPFGGGVFGGNVVFLYRGKTYKIERTFDKASKTKDTLTVYRDGVPCTEFADPVGEAIFGIDKASFERTVFITSGEVALSSTDSINTKLNNFLEGSDDDTNLRAATERLDKQIKTYKKQKLSAGLLRDETARGNELKERIANCTAIRNGLPAKYERLRAYEREIKERTDAVTAAQNENVVRANWEHYDKQRAEIAESERRIAAIQAAYPFGIPPEEETEQAAAYAAALERERALAQKKIFTEEDAAKYAALREKFSAGVPAEEALTDAQEAIGRVQALRAEAAALRARQDTEKDAALQHRFSAHAPTEQDRTKLEEACRRYKITDSAYEQAPDYLTAAAPAPAAPPKKAALIAAVIAAVLLVAGVALLFVQLIAGIVLLALGAVGLLADGFLYLNKKSGSRAQAGAMQTENPEKAAIRAERERIASEIGAQVMPYGYSLQNGALYAAAAFLEDCKEYAGLQKKDEERAAALAQKEERAAAMQKKLDAFFGGYGAYADNDIRRLAQLRTDISDFRALQKRREDSDAAERSNRDAMERARGALLAYCRTYHIAEEGIAQRLKTVLADGRALADETKALQKKRADAAAFRESKHLTDRPAGEAADLAEMNGMLNRLQDEKNRLSQQIAEDERDAERGDALQNELAESEERLAEYKRRYSVLVKTKEFLELADFRLKEKYVRPIRESFLSYSALLERALGETIVIDANFNVRFEHGGIERSEEHLSAGQRSICALCFRLALIDNMYAEEKPFLILDDPFVNLDGEHLQKVKALLAELAKNMQIVYFSCHESRMM